VLGAPVVPPSVLPLLVVVEPAVAVVDPDDGAVEAVVAGGINGNPSPPLKQCQYKFFQYMYLFNTEIVYIIQKNTYKQLKKIKIYKIIITPGNLYY